MCIGIVVDKITAKGFLDALACIEAPISKMEQHIWELEESERRKYLELTGNLMKYHFEFMMSVVNEYPELDPDGLGEKHYKKLKCKYSKNK